MLRKLKLTSTINCLACRFSPGIIIITAIVTAELALLLYISLLFAAIITNVQVSSHAVALQSLRSPIPSEVWCHESSLVFVYPLWYPSATLSISRLSSLSLVVIPPVSRYTSSAASEWSARVELRSHLYTRRVTIQKVTKAPHCRQANVFSPFLNSSIDNLPKFGVVRPPSVRKMGYDFAPEKRAGKMCSMPQPAYRLLVKSTSEVGS